MGGHEIEHYDLAPEAEALPYGAREFAQTLGHQAVSGGDTVMDQGNPERPPELLVQLALERSRYLPENNGVAIIREGQSVSYVVNAPRTYGGGAESRAQDHAVAA